MFFKQKIEENTDLELAEKIKKDLVSTFKKKGIDIASIQIEMKSGSMNIEVFMNEKNK
jgi:membrane protease subunit (stomatin/prohibitin family)